jgi:diguanylate cyclase (GGDEF)-like protein
MKLTRDELRAMATQGRSITLAAGETLFREGEPGEEAYFIHSGVVEIFSTLRGHNQTLALRGGGEFIGEMALLGDGRRGASARAQERCRLRSLPREGLVRLLSAHPEMALQLCGRLVARMNEAQKSMMAQLTGQVEELQALNQTLEQRVEERTAELSEANRKLAEAATLDFLTETYNRRYLHEFLERRCLKEKAFGIIMFDIDNFKHFNDTHGHQAGDDLLRIFSRVVRSQLGADDLLARYGGEEFTAIVEVTDGVLLHKIADRIRATVARRAHPGVEQQPLGRLSCSGGTACFPGEATTPQGLFKIADARLYRAKEMGRDRIVSD